MKIALMVVAALAALVAAVQVPDLLRQFDLATAAPLYRALREHELIHDIAIPTVIALAAAIGAAVLHRMDRQAASLAASRAVSAGPRGWPMTLGTGQTSMKRCPQCAEMVQQAAKICRFCRYTFPAPRSRSNPDSTPRKPGSA